MPSTNTQVTALQRHGRPSGDTDRLDLHQVLSDLYRRLVNVQRLVEVAAHSGLDRLVGETLPGNTRGRRLLNGSRLGPCRRYDVNDVNDGTLTFSLDVVGLARQDATPRRRALGPVGESVQDHERLTA